MTTATTSAAHSNASDPDDASGNQDTFHCSISHEIQPVSKINGQPPAEPCKGLYGVRRWLKQRASEEPWTPFAKSTVRSYGAAAAEADVCTSFRKKADGGQEAIGAGKETDGRRRETTALKRVHFPSGKADAQAVSMSRADSCQNQRESVSE